MLPTPSTTHIDPTLIYPPAEDSHLLLDTLSSASETHFLSARFAPPSSPPLFLEIGTGSGVVLAFAAAHRRALFGRDDVLTLGTDVNAAACEAAARTVGEALGAAGATAAGFLGCVVGDLAWPVAPGRTDVLVFNPPYVPSELVPPLPSSAAPTTSAHLLSLATDGGPRGLATTNRLLARLDAVLGPRGVAYVLLCARNGPDAVVRRVRAWGAGWGVRRVVERTAGWERLCVVRIWRV